MKNVGYVAMTRAKDQLHLMVPRQFFTHGQPSTGDRHVYAQRTRFILNSVLDQLKSRSWSPPKSMSEGDGPAREPLCPRKDASNVGLTRVCETRRYRDQ
jgi:DNA helicase-2/ATP-dependent DNA helicase PcrA